MNGEAGLPLWWWKFTVAQKLVVSVVGYPELYFLKGQFTQKWELFDQLLTFVSLQTRKTLSS